MTEIINTNLSTKLRINNIIVKERFRRDSVNVDTLMVSMQKLGLLEPILVDKATNELIAGYRRLIAAKTLGWQEINVELKSLDDPRDAEVDENIERMQYTPGDCLIIEDYYLERERRAAEERQKSGKKIEGFDKGNVVDKVAKRTGRSSKTNAKARAIRDAARTNPDNFENLWKMVDAGKVPIDKGFNEYRTLNNKLQTAHLIRQAATATATESLPSRIQLKLGDFRDVCKSLPDNSIPLIFTDPPYAREFLPLFKDLGEVASRVLEPGGSLVTNIGQYNLPQIIDWFREAGLTYWWQLAIIHAGDHQQMYDRRVFVYWKPLLWFVKNPPPSEKTTSVMPDLIKSEIPNKSLHSWAQSPIEAEHIIRHLTLLPTQTVLDPFMGSGTTGIAAIRVNRKFLGIELDHDVYSKAHIRLYEEIQSKNTDKYDNIEQRHANLKEEDVEISQEALKEDLAELNELDGDD